MNCKKINTIMNEHRMFTLVIEAEYIVLLGVQGPWQSWSGKQTVTQWRLTTTQNMVSRALKGC